MDNSSWWCESTVGSTGIGWTTPWRASQSLSCSPRLRNRAATAVALSNAESTTSKDAVVWKNLSELINLEMWSVAWGGGDAGEARARRMRDEVTEERM